MSTEVIDWEQDVQLDADEAYESLVRSLKRTDGFSLLFVRCSPAQGDRIISDIRSDLSSKTIEVLELSEPIDNLYDCLATLPNREQINILFIKGLEHSIFAYEDREMNDINLRSRSSIYGGTWQGIPRVLGHLNLSRERLRDNFKFCFVFLLPEFALRYFIRRAPDFFDWRSNIYEFYTDKETVNQEANRLVYLDGDYEEYCELIYVERIAKLSTILSYLDEKPEPNNEADLWFQKGLIHYAASEYEEVIASFDRALEIKPDDDEALCNRGVALGNLGRYEEAIASYDKALEIKPDYPSPYFNKACVYSLQNQIELALENLQKAIQLSPEEYRKMAKTDIDFDSIRCDPGFQALIFPKET
jgi:tetratricopeptide (TPR) repeat protein